MECFNISNSLKMIKKTATQAPYKLKEIIPLTSNQELLFNSYLGIPDKPVRRSL